MSIPFVEREWDGKGIWKELKRTYSRGELYFPKYNEGNITNRQRKRVCIHLAVIKTQCQ